MKKQYLVCMTIFLLFLITGCSRSKVDTPITTNKDYTNNQILLYSFDYYNTYSTSEPVRAEIWNMTEKVIKFPNNFNLRIFEKTKSGWEELFEKPVTRLPPGNFEFNNAKDDSNIVMIVIFPNLPDISREYDLRIYVSGQLYENEEIIEVFAYTDVTLKP